MNTIQTAYPIHNALAALAKAATAIDMAAALLVRQPETGLVPVEATTTDTTEAPVSESDGDQ